MRIKTAAAILLGTFAALAVSILTSALGHADDVFIACPSGRDGVATLVTSCEFADNVRRAYLSQYGPVVLAFSPGHRQCVRRAVCRWVYRPHELVVDAVRCVGGKNAVVVLW
jgi:hypothetical protein